MDSSEYVPMNDPKCFVPSCKNNSRKDADKLFFSVPNSAKQEWCNAVNTNCPKRVLYICEDHLNLEEDMENYRYWIAVKGWPILKSQLPKSLCRTTSQEPEIIEPMPSTSAISITDIEIKDIEMSIGKPIITKLHKGIQVKPKQANRATHCALSHKRAKSQQIVTECVPMEDEIPSTQGSTTSADISEMSSAVSANPVIIEGRSFMLKLIKKNPMII